MRANSSRRQPPSLVMKCPARRAGPIEYSQHAKSVSQSFGARKRLAVGVNVPVPGKCRSRAEGVDIDD